jgi:outer membrane receptor protein involved in Fe transport
MTFAQRVLTQEIRLSSTDPAARVSWVAGLFYSKSTQRDIFNYYSDDVTVPNGLPLGTSILDTETKVNDTQLAAFGQADIEIAQGLKLSTGLRVARTKFDETTLSAGLFNFGTPPVASGGTSETPITPKVALSYKLDDTLYYASVAKGYRTGGVNSPIPSYCSRPATEFFSSDNVWSYEIGAKSSLADNRLRIDVSAFHIRWNNIQQAVALTDCGYGYIANTGEAVSNGFDLSVNAIPMKDLTVGLGVAYTSAHFTKDVTVDDLPIVRNGDAIGTLIGGTALSPWSVSLTANREFALPFAGATGYLWAQDIYHSKNPGPFTSDIPGGISYNPDLVTNPSMNRVNFRFGIRSDSYDISLFVNNAFDTHPNLNKSLLAGVASPIVSYSTLRPRTVGLSAAYHF